MADTNAPTPARWFDAAVALTVATATLYALGWVYWSTFFWYFGLQVTMVGLSFEHVVSTTWVLAVVLAFWTLTRVVHPAALLDHAASGVLELQAGGIVLLVLLGLVPLAAALPWHPWTLVAGAILAFALMATLRRRTIILKRRSARMLAFLLGTAFLLGVYAIAGYSEAIQRAHGRGASCVNVQTFTDPQPAADLVVLARSSGMLFVTPRDAPRPNQAAIVIAETAVRTATVGRCER